MRVDAMHRAARRRRLLVLGGLTLAILMVVLAWSRKPKGSGYATPDACLAAFRDATLDGDAVRYRSCLGEPLRSETQRRYADDAALIAALREGTRGVKHWVEASRPDEQGDRAFALVEEVRVTGQRRLEVYLERSGAGWLIVRVEKGEERPAAVRYGTPAGEPSRPEPLEDP
jgi:hypothetical protein